MVVYNLDQNFECKDSICLASDNLNSVSFSQGNFYIFPNKNNIFDKYIEDNKLKIYKDYVYSETLKKKIVVFYGNCHLIPIQEMLNKTSNFKDSYFIWPILGICQISDPKYFEHPVFSTFCNIFIDQEIQKNNSYGEKYSSEYIQTHFLNKSAKRIVVPNTYKLPLFLFPQCDNSFYYFYNDKHVFFKDTILEEYYSKHFLPMSNKKYFEKLSSLNVDFKEKEDLFFEKVRNRELKWDVKISDFIKENLNEGLYCDPHHPSFKYLVYLYEEICEHLGLVAEKFSKKEIVNLDPVEMPSILDIGNFKKKYRETSFVFPIKNFTIRKYIHLYRIVKNNYDKKIWFVFKYKIKIFLFKCKRRLACNCFGK